MKLSSRFLSSQFRITLQFACWEHPQSLLLVAVQSSWRGGPLLTPDPPQSGPNKICARGEVNRLAAAF